MAAKEKKPFFSLQVKKPKKNQTKKKSKTPLLIVLLVLDIGVIGLLKYDEKTGCIKTWTNTIMEFVAELQGQMTGSKENKKKYTIKVEVQNGTQVAGSETVEEGSVATVTVSANSGFILPETITVVGANYTYNSTTGGVLIKQPTGNVTITVVCVPGI